MVKIQEEYSTHVVIDVLFNPTQELLSPSTGEAYLVGDSVPIRWEADSTLGITSVDILLSVNGGNFNALSLGEVNDGEYDWYAIIPDVFEVKLVYHFEADPTQTVEVQSGQFQVFPQTRMRYIDVSTETKLNYEGTPYSSVSFDYDSDGLQDLFIAISDNYSHLYQCDQISDNGVPEFFRTSDQHVHPSDTPQANLHGLAVADYDNDGDEDFFAGADEGNNPRLYCYNDTIFVDKAAETGLLPYAGGGWSAAWVDYDDDGLVDLAIGLAYHVPPGLEPGNFGARTVYLLKNDTDASGTFIDKSQDAGWTSISGVFLSVTWGDIDADGDQDAFLAGFLDYSSLGAGASSSSRLMVNNGDGTFAMPLLQDRFPENHRIQSISGASFIDMDNDGDLDLTLSSQSEIWMEPWILFNDGNGFFNEQEHVRLADIGKTQGHSVIDHDLDGNTDFLLLPASGSDHPWLFTNKVVGSKHNFLDETGTVDLDDTGKIHGATAIDWNTDGDIDLYMGRPVVSGDFFYQATDVSGVDAPLNNWISINLVGTGANNESSVGALVTVSYDGKTPAQVVDGGSARGGQRGHDLIYGLGDWTGGVDVTVIWPNGFTQSDSFTVGQLGQVHQIGDMTDPGLDDSTVHCTKNMMPTGDIEWVFTWKTAYRSRAELDQVEISGPGFGNPSTYNAAPNSIVKNTDGTYSHTVSFVHACQPGNQFPYSVSSSTDLVTSTSASHNARVRLCLTP